MSIKFWLLSDPISIAEQKCFFHCLYVFFVLPKWNTFTSFYNFCLFLEVILNDVERTFHRNEIKSFFSQRVIFLETCNFLSEISISCLPSSNWTVKLCNLQILFILIVNFSLGQIYISWNTQRTELSISELWLSKDKVTEAKKITI